MWYTAQNIKNIFEPFVTYKKYGTGIGLAIVKQIVNSHRGNIKVTSDIGLGTCFEIEFPLGGGRTDDQSKNIIG